MDGNLEERMKAIPLDTTVFIGLGNTHMGDDAAGVLLAKILSKGGLNTLEAGNDLMGAMHNLSSINSTHAVFIDAAGMGLEPGDMRIIEENEISGRCISTHENNFPLAIHYMKCLNPCLDITFIGIQFNTLELQEKPKLSPEVMKAVECLARMILSLREEQKRIGCAF